MTLFDFIRLLYRNASVIITVPIVLAAAVIFFTRNEDKAYTTQAVVYTGIASGFNIEGEDGKMDYREVNNAFDNLMLVIQSRITLEEVALRLLSIHLLADHPSYTVIGEKAYTALNEYLTPDLKVKAIDINEEATYERLRVLYEAGNPLLVNLINKGTSHWSIKKLGSISAKREKSSDMLVLSYTSTDPAICQQSLQILLDVFTKRYKALKGSETGDVVAYFESELDRVKKNLNDAEDRLTEFRVDSRVINYVEQTKAIAFKQQNAVEEYSLKKMNLSATKAALDQIEEKLKIRENILNKNVEVLDKKRRLAEITSELALAEAKNANDSLLNVYSTEQKNLKEDLRKDLEMLFNFSNSKEGLPSRQLLNDWLNNLVQMEREQVIVDLYQGRLDEIDAEYDRYAPMGSTIARLEREISINEREFLEIRHGLNMAKLRQQHIEMSSNVEIVDKPQLPLEPLSSKRMLLVIVAFVFGTLASIATFLALELLDNTLKNPVKAKKITGMDIGGALPFVTSNFEKKYGNVVARVTGILASKLKLEKQVNRTKGPTLIIGVSTQEDSGISFGMNQLFEQMLDSGEIVAFIAPEGTLSSRPHYFEYVASHQLPSIEFVAEKKREFSHYQYVLMEIPAWVEGKIPVHTIEEANVILWFVRADKVWSTANKNMQQDLAKITSVPPMLVLNGVKPYYLDQIIGELPVKRTALTRWIRKIVRFEFGNSGIKGTSK